MNLWTWQGPTWDITSGELDHSKSPYCVRNDAPRIRDAYAKLHQMLGKQVVWCYTNERAAKRPHESERVQWVLDVPDNRIVGFTNDWVWERLIGSRAYPHSELSEAVLTGGISAGERDAFEQCWIQEYFAQKPPYGDWWLELFVKFPPPSSVDLVSALVEHPIDKSWVIKDGRV